MANTEYTREINGQVVQVLPIEGKDFVSVTDATAISGFSRAYINKSLNSGAIAGMQLPGLGWLADLESLNEFSATTRRAPGKATLLAKALELFLKELGEGVYEEWQEVEKRTLAEYKAKKEQAAEDSEDATEEAEVA